tara:strand:- start:1456 stop:1914 length:459 start_codon:yes stop_codon:yes gene_type:complete
MTFNNKVEINKIDINNYYNISNLYETSGQPNKQQLKLLVKKGYEVIINLAPHSIYEGRVLHEREILKSNKVIYIHIPVNFKKPIESDFNKFVLNIEKYKNKKMWVHCEANMRVSAFTYKYRKDILKLSKKDIINDLEAIWIPNKTWSSFLEL